MLTAQNKKLLEMLETKYVTMLGMVSDIARIELGEASEQTGLEKYILDQRQEIHHVAQALESK